MNFPYRDFFGEVEEAQRVKHLSESVTVDALIKYSQGKTLSELQFDAGHANPATLIDSEINLGFGIEQKIRVEISEQGLGPNGHRYIQDVNNPGRVIDMRHFIEAADIPFGQGEALGLFIEAQ